MQTVEVKGMTCQGCVQAVTRAVGRIAPPLRVDLASGRVDLPDGADLAKVRAAIVEAGFEVAA